MRSPPAPPRARSALPAAQAAAEAAVEAATQDGPFVDRSGAAADARRSLARTRATADLLFLVGLLAGGPLITFGGRLRAGLFLVLGGGLASALRRRTAWSTPGVVVMGAAAAALVAAVVAEPLAHAADQEGAPGVEARAAYVEELDRRTPDGRVEARGPASLTVWFVLADTGPAACGTVPDAPVREHLAELGFQRVVVADRSAAGGLCSFRP